MKDARLVTFALTAATAASVAILADATSISMMAAGVSSRIVPALLVNAGAALVVYLEGAITRSGAIAGGLIGTAVYVGSGWEGWLVLLATFVCAVSASRVGLERKKALGIAQEDEGERSARHVVANCGVAAAAAIVAVTSPFQSEAWLVLVTALTAGGADTSASEIGKAYGRRTYLIVGLRRAPPGTPGAISLEGSLANLFAALALAILSASLGLIGGAAIPLVTIAALAGSSVESVLGATLEPRGILNNQHLNYINTAVAAGVVPLLGA